MTGPARLVRSEFRFEPPADAEPIPVVGHTRVGEVLAHIHPGACELRVVVHQTVGVHVDVTGPAVHERTGKPNAHLCLTAQWEPDGGHSHADLAEAPQWVQDAVQEVTGR